MAKMPYAIHILFNIIIFVNSHSHLHHTSEGNSKGEHTSQDGHLSLVRQNTPPTFLMNPSTPTYAIPTAFVFVIMARNDHRINLFNDTDSCHLELNVNNINNEDMDKFYNYINNKTIDTIMNINELTNNNSLPIEYSNTINDARNNIKYFCVSHGNSGFEAVVFLIVMAFIIRFGFMFVDNKQTVHEPILF